jgi:hypothetical protein
MESISNSNINQENLSEDFESFYKTFSDELDKKFTQIETLLDDKKILILDSLKNEIKQVELASTKMKSLENIVMSQSEKKKPEDLNNYKNAANDYIKKCEELDSHMLSFKESKLEDIIKITRKGFAIEKGKISLNKLIRDKNSKITELKWRKNQKKTCILTEKDTKIHVDFNSCWNDFHSENLSKGENEIFLEITLKGASTYLSVGVTNENFNGTSTCIGCQDSNDAFLLKFDGKFKFGSSNKLTDKTNFNIPVNGIFYLSILVDTEKKILTFKNKQGNVAGPFNIQGNEFKVTFGQCSSGSMTLKSLDGFE